MLIGIDTNPFILSLGYRSMPKLLKTNFKILCFLIALKRVFSNYISPVGLFFNAIFRLTDFSSDPFDFSSSVTGAPSVH